MTYLIQHTDCITLMQSMVNNAVTATITDIPYGVVNRDLGVINAIRSLDKGDADVMTFDLQKFLNEIVRVTSGSIYIFCSSEQVSEIRSTLVASKLTTRHCFWEKTDPSPFNGQHFWLSSIENCIFARKSKATFNEFCKSPVWRESIERFIKDHPTPKSVLLLKRLIEASTNPGDVVLDPCMGSGSTGLACKMTEREFIGGDINEDYVNAAIERIESLDVTDNPWLRKLAKRNDK